MLNCYLINAQCVVLILVHLCYSTTNDDFMFTSEYFVHIIAENNFFFDWQIFVSIIGTFVEHNKGRCWALEQSIIGKIKSIICMCLEGGGRGYH